MSRLVSDEVWAIMTIWMEARGEPYEGKVAVAEVIRNRQGRRYASDGTVAGTVLRAYQFSAWNSQERARLHAAALDDTDPVVDDCRRAWEEARAGSIYARGAVLYLNPLAVQQTPNWADPAREVAVIGGHHFFAA